MPKITIDSKSYEVPEKITIIQACEIADIEIPRFCYHEKLAIAGNCRMCLVEVVGGPPKPVASCAMEVVDGMEVKTDSKMVKNARKGVMEFLLANHPLDCPICDQGGECDLQDQAYHYGKGNSEFTENKRAVKDKDLGPLIKTHMTRCIHCTRCVRFMEDVAGTTELGAVNRGEEMEITSYLEKGISSELSGNIIDLCPVGALTSKPYAFKARSWELKKTETVDVMDGVGSNIRIDSRGNEVLRILPIANDEINEDWISDKARFCYDGLKYQRLNQAYIKNDSNLASASIDTAYDKIAEKIGEVKPDQIAALTGRLSSFDEIYALKKLLESIKVDKFDCRLSNEKLSPKNRADYLFNSTIAGIEESDLCVLIGANPKKDAPTLNAKIKHKSLNKSYPIASIGCAENLGYETLDLGDSPKVLSQILSGDSDFTKTLKQSKRPLFIYGNDLVSRSDGDKIINQIKQIVEKYKLNQDGWNPLNFLSKSTGLINGLEAGFVGSSNIEQLLDEARSGKIKLVILHGVDDDIDFEALKKCFVIYIGSHGDIGAHNADIILPAKAFSEKESLYINIEGRAQKTKIVNLGPNGSHADIEIIYQLSKKLGNEIDPTSKSDSISTAITENQLELNQARVESWSKSLSDAKALDKKISISDYDFYLTNPIARSSKILNNASSSLKNQSK